jgi:hypothetical protein
MCTLNFLVKGEWDMSYDFHLQEWFHSFYFVISYVCRLIAIFSSLVVCRPEDDHIRLKHVADLN